MPQDQSRGETLKKSIRIGLDCCILEVNKTLLHYLQENPNALKEELPIDVTKVFLRLPKEHAHIPKTPTEPLAEMSIKRLNLSQSEFNFENHLIDKLNALPKPVTDLNLSSNVLGRKSAAEISDMLRMFYNALKEPGGKPDDIVKIIRALPESVTHLGLDGNQLGLELGAELVEVMRAVPGSVTSMGLGSNELFRKKPQGLKSILNAIPATVKYVDLSGNDLEELSSESLLEIFSDYVAAKNLAHLIAGALSTQSQAATPWSGFFTHTFRDGRIFLHGLAPLLLGNQLRYDPKTTTRIEAAIKEVSAKNNNLPYRGQ